ncbi:macrophage mannose receptor 1-like [Triplophysa dalaica]|uniref:macrophage mannose receptor 1-like n=1 Tax=Triplophysa dalaica TaxID=1582913 RepID=UPI0024E01736|nr:macrophage mannose receptor 1-like [Triplophysa dalaica]
MITLPCNEHSPLQTWDCKKETLYGIKDQPLHLNNSNREEKNIMLFRGPSVWGRWQIYGSQDDLCSYGYQVSSNELWIGLNDQNIQNLFEWSDRKHVSFTRWIVGEPSHINSRMEDCVLMKGKEGKWADEACEAAHGYICKKKASIKPEGSTHMISPGSRQSPPPPSPGLTCALRASRTGRTPFGGG